LVQVQVQKQKVLDIQQSELAVKHLGSLCMAAAAEPRQTAILGTQDQVLVVVVVAQ
jgi:hypothetical protein